MIKKNELADPRSCLNKANEDEYVFVLLGRDAAAPAAIHAWVTERINRGLNSWNDDKIIEALNAARYIQFQHMEEAASKRHMDKLRG